MSLVCRRTRRRLAAAMGGELESKRLEAHCAACLRCQAEASRYRRIAREMAELGAAPEPAPSALAAAVGHRVAQLVAAEGRTEEPASAGSQAAAKVAVAGALAAAAGTAVAVRLVRSRPVG